MQLRYLVAWLTDVCLMFKQKRLLGNVDSHSVGVDSIFLNVVHEEEFHLVVDDCAAQDIPTDDYLLMWYASVTVTPAMCRRTYCTLDVAKLFDTICIVLSVQLVFDDVIPVVKGHAPP